MFYCFLEVVSKENFEGATWLHQTVYSKIWEERHDLKMELLSKNEQELLDLENPQSIHIVKKRESIFRREC